MKFQNVCLETIACILPEEVVTTAEIEGRLEPLYRRLRLPEGRLELITGVRERRFWPRGTRVTEMSVQSGDKAIRAAGIDRREIGVLIHASVCRDFLEPATACGVHHQLDLSRECQIYDVSNACLGMLNGVVQIANMIELGQTRAGLVVGTESGRSLVDNTIDQLNRDTSLKRGDIKQAIASLTIGSGSAAILVTHPEISRSGNRILGGTAVANTTFHALCHSGSDEAGGDQMRPTMNTDSETLMREGIATAKETFERFLGEMDWDREDVQKTFCHQVGTTHRRLLFEALEADDSIDYPTVETLGNTGSVALPTAMALGIKEGHLRRGDQVAMLGVGSGINCLMLGIDWQQATIDHGAGNPGSLRRKRPSVART